MKLQYWGVLLLLFALTACNGDENTVGETNNNVSTGPLFTELDPANTGVGFVNRITEDNNLNFFTFEYIYNGGGIAVGDINNDDLPDLYFSATMEPNKLYLNKGDFKFEDITTTAGVAVEQGLKTGVSMVDINADGLLDIFVCRTGKEDLALRTNQLFINNGDLTFTESAAAYGLADPCNSNHANFFDYDLDGDLDLYLINHPIEFSGNNRPRVVPAGSGYERLTTASTTEESDRLYRNNGDGTFTNISKQAGIDNRAFGLSTAVGDFNEDGLPDLYVANDFIEPDFLYINNGDGTFTDRFYDYFRHTCKSSMGSDYSDINNDGYNDLLTLDMLVEEPQRRKNMATDMVLDKYETLLQFDYGPQIMCNMLQLNNGNQGYSEIAKMSGVHATDWSWGPLFADYDNDGWKDLFVANGYKRDVANLDFIVYRASISNQSNSVFVSDIHEILDLIPQNKVQNYMYKNNGDLTFSDVSDQWGFDAKTFSNGTAFGDLDADGDLELIINNIDDPALIYKNNAVENGKGNWLALDFKGPGQNVQGIGAKVEIEAGGKTQVLDNRVIRGFFSSMESMVHFGLAGATTVEQLKVTWPDGKVQLMNNVQANQRLTLNYNDATNNAPIEAGPSGMFEHVTYNSGLDFFHKENAFSDFKRERLLPQELSNEGPALAKGDVNGDGLEDLYLGGAAGQSSVLFLQTANGKFSHKNDMAIAQDQSQEDVDAVFADFDGDDDLDLYVVSGGNAFNANSPIYQDRLYWNDGSGNFSKAAEKTLPKMYTSGGCVTVADYDGDGDVDLFVGGRTLPGRYPTAPRSYILKNNGGVFVDATESVAPGLTYAGMVNDAEWIDINNDGPYDLVVVGDWMPVTIYINQSGSLQNETDNYGLGNSNSWWNTIYADDFDDDGDVDLVGGSWGTNTKFYAAPHEPLELYAMDFDGNGNIDPIMTMYEFGVSWPIPTRNNLLGQMSVMAKKFTSYELYSTAKIGEIFTPEQLAAAEHKMIYTLSNTYFENTGSSFATKPLPNMAQIAPVYAVLSSDVNGDGNKDMIIAGNNINVDVESGPNDAGNGLVLLGDGKGNFEPLSVPESGFYVPQQARGMISITTANGSETIVVANNNAMATAFVRKSTVM